MKIYNTLKRILNNINNHKKILKKKKKKQLAVINESVLYFYDLLNLMQRKLLSTASSQFYLYHNKVDKLEFIKKK